MPRQLLERHEIESRVRQFIDSQILGGQGAGLTAATPLFELGILDSFALFAVIDFIANELGVELPLEALDAQKLATTAAIAETVHVELYGSARPS